MKRTKINKKRPGLAVFVKKQSVLNPNQFDFQVKHVSWQGRIPQHRHRGPDRLRHQRDGQTQQGDRDRQVEGNK